jgi:hypothetical protein
VGIASPMPLTEYCADFKYAMLAVDPDPQGLLNGGNASSPSGLHLSHNYNINHELLIT